MAIIPWDLSNKFNGVIILDNHTIIFQTLKLQLNMSTCSNLLSRSADFLLNLLGKLHKLLIELY